MIRRGRALLSTTGTFFLLITGDGKPDTLGETAASMGFRRSRAEDACAVIVARNKRGEEFKTGSGFFINSNGWFVTNYHVIEGAYSASLRTWDGAQHEARGLINVWPRGDLAILVTSRTNTTWLPLADPRDTKAGLNLILLGAPGGVGWLCSTATVEAVVEEGTVRTVQYKIELEGAGPGSSGAPLMDSHGRVHAIHSKWQPRVLLNENGEWRLSWKEPQIRGIHSGELARLLGAPPRPMPLARVGSLSDNAVAANVFLAVCVVTDPVLREVRNLMNGTAVAVQPVRVPRDVISASGDRYDTVNFVAVAAPVGMDIVSVQLGRFQFILHAILADLSGDDPALESAIREWRRSLDHLRQGIQRLGTVRSGEMTVIARLLDAVRRDFRDANECFRLAVEGGWEVWRKYAGWSQEPPIFNEGLVRAALEFYGERKLELTNWP